MLMFNDRWVSPSLAYREHLGVNFARIAAIRLEEASKFC